MKKNNSIEGQQTADPACQSTAPCYALDIVEAGKQANDAMSELDGSPSGLVRANVKARNMIFAAYHLGRADFDT